MNMADKTCAGVRERSAKGGKAGTRPALPAHAPRAGEGGFSLLEVLISVLLFSVGLLALIGMQAAVVGNTMDAEYRVQASYQANRIIGRMWVDRGNLAEYATESGSSANLDAWLDEVAAALPGADGDDAPTITVDAGSGQVDIVIRWRRPGDGELRSFRTTTFINGAT